MKELAEGKASRKVIKLLKDDGETRAEVGGSTRGVLVIVGALAAGDGGGELLAVATLGFKTEGLGIECEGERSGSERGDAGDSDQGEPKRGSALLQREGKQDGSKAAHRAMVTNMANTSGLRIPALSPILSTISSTSPLQAVGHTGVSHVNRHRVLKTHP